MGVVILQEGCNRLRALHIPGTPLVLPNAWDAASARAVVAGGFPGVATTSGGVAEALGYEDGERAPAAERFAGAARKARAGGRSGVGGPEVSHRLTAGHP